VPSARCESGSSARQLLALQRLAGNRAVSQLLRSPKSPAPPRPAPTPSPIVVVQRAKNHFWKYLNQKAPNVNPTVPTDKELLIVAWLLDQNMYDIEAMLQGSFKLASHDTLANVGLLSAKNLTLHDVGAFLHSKGAPGAQQTGQMAWLHAVL